MALLSSLSDIVCRTEYLGGPYLLLLFSVNSILGQP